MKKDSGLSNVVGVVLLLSLVIVTASILGFVLSSATYDAVDSTPNVIFTTSEDPYMLYNGGGDILYKNKLEFYAGGYNVNSYISLVDSGVTNSDWTEWHTGQAIKISYDGYSVSDLAIVTLDSYGKEYLVYDGPTADPIPSGNPVPDVTPVPTPAPVKPDASFTLTSVIVGENVPLGILPFSLANSSDYFVVMEKKWIDGYWVNGGHYNDWGRWVYGWYQVPGYWDTYAYVGFTAVETEGVTYSWSSTGPDSHVFDLTSNPAYVRFNTTGDYSITLEVTNITSGLSNSSTQTVSVRNPGLTVMMWIKHDNWSDQILGNYWNYPSFEAYNYYNWYYNWYHKWEFKVDSSTNKKNNNNKYDLEFNLGSSSASVQGNDIILNEDTWYHVTGTFKEGKSSIFASDNLNIYVDGSIIGTSTTTTSSLAYTDKGSISFGDTNHFEYDPPLPYEIPFALTQEDIKIVYDAEDMDSHTP